LDNKAVSALVFILLLFIGIIALTQESPQADNLSPRETAENENRRNTEDASELRHDAGLSDDIEYPQWLKPARWFRSNAGGMALEEIPSRLAAIRNQYALVIDYADYEELPEYLVQYYNDDFYIETRSIYKDRIEVRQQWIFRDSGGMTRLIAVFTGDSGNENIVNEAGITGTNSGETVSGDGQSESEPPDSLAVENEEEFFDSQSGSIINYLSGFIEIFNKDGFITSEIKLFDDGNRSKTDYTYKDGIKLSAAASEWTETENGGSYSITHIDNFRYNRSMFLRAVERIFHRDTSITKSGDFVRIAFPGNILDAARNDNFINEKLNPLPEFFGYIIAEEDYKMIFTTDDRGRILSQTLTDKNDDVIWIIINTWQDDRIARVIKKEDDVELAAEYEYDSGGNRTVERNIRNGELERLVRTVDGKDIEELFINNIIVMTAVWDNGRKISETRIKNN